jgi:hypothetical protein
LLIDAVVRCRPGLAACSFLERPGRFPDYTADLRARARGLPVEFMGGFPRERTEDVYAQMDVLAVPSLWLENSPW